MSTESDLKAWKGALNLKAYVPAKCSNHPGYKAIGQPRPSGKHPDGCMVCWTIYNLKGFLKNGKARRVY